MYTKNADRLLNVTRLLNLKKADMDPYYYEYVFKPYGIDIANCLIDQNLKDAKKLLDFSFTTRQGSQNKTALESYEKNENKILEKLKFTLAILLNGPYDIIERYERALALINSIEGIGQKIAAMYIKFLIYYSRDFAGKIELERELFIPFDIHVIKLIFTQFNGEKNNRLDLYDESINQSYLLYDIASTSPFTLKNSKLLKLQHNIRDDFDKLEIEEPPIILDYLWYIGMIYCSNRLGNIGCNTCFLRSECETGKMSF